MPGFHDSPSTVVLQGITCGSGLCLPRDSYCYANRLIRRHATKDTVLNKEELRIKSFIIKIKRAIIAYIEND